MRSKRSKSKRQMGKKEFGYRNSRFNPLYISEQSSFAPNIGGFQARLSTRIQWRLEDIQLDFA
jgi:hypothetical protein